MVLLGLDHVNYLLSPRPHSYVPVTDMEEAPDGVAILPYSSAAVSSFNSS